MKVEPPWGPSPCECADQAHNWEAKHQICHILRFLASHLPPCETFELLSVSEALSIWSGTGKVSWLVLCTVRATDSNVITERHYVLE